MTYHPFQTIGEARTSRWLITCDHATSTVPPCVNGGTLGLPPADMTRHIAFDPGAAGVTRHLAALLDAPAVLSNFSRLVIDPNRGEDDPTLIMQLYDGSVIPANRRLDPAERDRRLERFYRPYHRAVARLAARQAGTLYIAIHSFTPCLKGRPSRPWHIGVLHADDTRLARPLIDRLRSIPDLCVGENEPYGGHLPGDSVDRHAVTAGRPNALIELRNDLIAHEDDQRAWAERLAPILQAAARDAGL
ncbi:putative N-formylglutamate amidohydrolase [Rhodovulum imhoffii]|uniref:Putative N-formylglutamate amidohydrolase n=1 Tax=Rhodovulum imhoffii TaxID=365340 RepID=A0A2T5BUA8_9RHOB|nr:N-formylglutamate amidohydrolase [Rhodovulum imhoffii]MBK5934536.1 N-formylglutamate amidohydrolase [Rhodovulum imhoffii]PTN03047.1 putative N-formylglutamate amidohydrolase [Rhodovulum imhoffii]